MTIDETIKVCEENAEKIGGNHQSDYHASWYKQVAEWLRELKEAKRLLKVAVEDFAKMNYHIYDCDRECDACPLSGERDHCFKWRYADEALKLIGGSENG